MSEFTVSFIGGDPSDPGYQLTVSEGETSDTCTLASPGQGVIKTYQIRHPAGFDSEDTLHDVEMQIWRTIEDARRWMGIDRIVRPEVPWPPPSAGWIRLLFVKVLRGESLPLRWREPYKVELEDVTTDG